MALDRIVVVALVDKNGAVLLRTRDEMSAVRANRWSLPGGGAEPGETPEQAAVRLVAEQASLTVSPQDLQLVWNGMIPGLEAVIYYFAAVTTATNKDIPIDPVPGAPDRYKGYVTRFVPEDAVLRGRTFTKVTGYVLGTFMNSVLYRDLQG
jgi:8-oxo-dGTP pyrophosphatase MutT (NUDIX family)